MKMFNKVLIANRGEIACRVIRSCQNLGVKTVAVFSDADEHALHTLMADEAVRIGASPSAESYLKYETIIETAKQTSAEAIHPGYGFLSENTAFAEACAEADIVFIGPSAEAINLMGDKAKAKALMDEASVPTVPGAYGSDLSEKDLKKAADKIGYPVLLKAVAGGGGKGMRVVEKAADFADAYAAAQREGESSFGNGEVMVEKYLGTPRHVEIQIFADSEGNCVYLFERDCSLQRRHQKVVEEAPAPHFSEDLRAQMGEAAVRAAQAVGYVGAGTVEFLLDGENFYFMEMNTRLQVEHPVTEAITGLDLVELQLSVAAGDTLPFTQEELTFEGHALEVRLYAEVPHENFMPSTGTLLHCKFPEENQYVRVDTGVVAGDTISHHYDPMIAKIITWGPTRNAALQYMQKALHDTQIVGVDTNAAYLANIMKYKDFAEGNVHTKLLERDQTAFLMPEIQHVDNQKLAALYWLETLAEHQPLSDDDPHSPWADMRGWRLGGSASIRIPFVDDELSAKAKGDNWVFDDGTVAHGTVYGEMVEAVIDGHKSVATVIEDEGALHVFSTFGHSILTLEPENELEADDTAVLGKLSAPLPGKVVKVTAKAGAKVEKGTSLMILEAMKTEHHITAPADGTVDELFFKVGETVDKDAVLLGFTPAAEKAEMAEKVAK